jgi:hypothetical protein
MAVLLPRRFPPSTAGTELITHRAEASTAGPGSGGGARPLHMSPALPRMSSAPPSVTWSPAARVVVVCRYGIAGNVGNLGHPAQNGWGRQRRSCNSHEADDRSG